MYELWLHNRGGMSDQWTIKGADKNFEKNLILYVERMKLDS